MAATARPSCQRRQRPKVEQLSRTCRAFPQRSHVKLHCLEPVVLSFFWTHCNGLPWRHFSLHKKRTISTLDAHSHVQWVDTNVHARSKTCPFELRRHRQGISVSLSTASSNGDEAKRISCGTGAVQTLPPHGGEDTNDLHEPCCVRFCNLAM